MKKTFFFITTMLFVVALFCQNTSIKNLSLPFPICSSPDEMQFVPAVNPSHHVPHAKGENWAPVGLSFYERLSNSSARTTVSTHPSGDMVNIWTFLPEYDTNNKNRGTGYNWYDKTTNQWGPGPGERLEQLGASDGNPGFPSHAFTVDGEIVVSHNPAHSSLMILTRDQRGTGAWNQAELKSNLPDIAAQWPCIYAVGNTIHMIAVYANTGSPVANNIPLYFRSKDAGKTWDINSYQFPEMPEADRLGHFADNYSIVANGDHVVYAYINQQGDVGRGNIGYMESMDGGDTWTYHQVLDCKYYSLAHDDNDFSYVGRNITVAIDEEEVIHIAFTGHVIYYGTDGNSYYLPLSSSLCYWKSTMPSLTKEYFNISRNPDETVNLGFLDFPNTFSMPELLGFDDFDVSENFNANWIQGNNGAGAIASPRIVVEDGIVYLLYSSIIQEPVGIFDVGAVTFFRGVFLTVSYDNGNTFEQKKHTSWISYDTRYFYCDWSKYVGPKDPKDFSQGIIGSIEVELPSENCYPTMALHSSKNELLIQWGNTLKAGILEAGECYDIFTVILSKNKAGIYNNTQEVYKGLWNNFNISVTEINSGIQEMAIYPNPAQNAATLFINAINSTPYTLTITNTMGQVISTQKGQLGYGKNNIELNISNFTSGLYIVNIKADNATRTQKLIVN